jgi:hypothetical protein
MEQAIGQIVLDTLVLTFNGSLVAVYWLFEHLPVAAAWPLVVGVIVLLDGRAGRQAGFRPRRYERGGVQRESETGYLGTLGLGALWTVIGLVAPAPVPLIGLAMWGTLLGVPLAIPMERDGLAGRLKWMLGVYALAVAAFLVLLRSQLDSQALAAWSRQLGTPGAGDALQAAITSSITPYAALLLWVIGPLVYFGYVAGRLAANWKTRVDPWASVEQRIRQVRGREKA